MSLLLSVKSLYEKYIGGEPPEEIEDIIECSGNKSSLGLVVDAYAEIAINEGDLESLRYINPLQKFLSSNLLMEDGEEDSEDGAEEGSVPGEEDSEGEEGLEFNTELEEEDPEEMSDGEESFANKYPTVDAQEVLNDSYKEWLMSVESKPFYKTIKGYYEMSLSGYLNYMERSFLWKFLKAISSAITHLLIEGEQKEEAISLVEKYYDSLVQCMNSVVHATDKEAVSQAFQYMIEFLNLVEEENSDESKSDEDF